MRTPAPISYLRLIIGIFFAAIGVFAILNLQHFSLVVGQDIPGLQYVFGILELIGGVALVVGVFTTFRNSFVHILNVVLFWVWIVKIVLNVVALAVPNFPSNSGVTLDAAGWVVSFALQLIVLSGLQVANRDYNLT